MIIKVNINDGYDIVLQRGILKNAGEYLDLNRKVFIITDDGVPAVYSQQVASCCKFSHIETVKSGEESKSLATFEKLLKKMLELGFSRGDCVVAVGGGVVGDLAGFTAASYMRGIDFYNIPTTVLSQVDSSIGGKTAVNFCGVKNIVGAFYQPKKVLIDPETLSSLPPRQISNGLAESVKMALTSDAKLFEMFETEGPLENIDEIIAKSIDIKRIVVEQDEKETGLRKILNFGHTIGHAIESAENLSHYYHGECVALGMTFMCSDSVKSRLEAVLEKLSLPVAADVDFDKIWSAMCHDKKFNGDSITVIYVPEAGNFEMKTYTKDELKNHMQGVFAK